MRYYLQSLEATMKDHQPSGWIVALLASLFAGGCESKPAPQQTQGAEALRGATVKAVLSLGTQGTIGVQSRVGGELWRSLAVGQKLPAGAWLRTTKGTRGSVELEDGSTLLLNQQTQLKLQGQRQLRVEAGELLARVTPSPQKQALQISTPAGKVNVTGTKLNLRVDKDRTVVDVTRGTVQVEGAGAKVEVGAGERAVVRPGKRPRVSLSRDLVQVTSWTREIGESPRSVEQLQEGFGSLTARVPGGGGARPLRLSQQKVRVTIRDNIARTEVEQVYYNPSSETLEGTYRFPLPTGASIARLALYVGKNLMEGEIVERQRARAIFNKIVNDTIQPRDPALLEWMGGRIFRMKIFPIPPRGARRVILAYVQPLDASYGRYSYVYPMSTSKGKATRVGKFSIDMKVSGTRGVADVEAPLYPVLKERDNEGVRLRYEATDFTPAASFVANFRPSGAVPEMQVALYEKKKKGGDLDCALRRPEQSAMLPACGDRGGFFMAVLRPELPLEGKARRRDYLFLMDSSHSMGQEGLAVQTSALEAFLAEMDLSSRINIMACDERCRVMGESFREPTAEARRAAMDFVRGITPGGSSNLQAAFEEAGQRAGAAGRPVNVVYLGDGRPTAGEMREPQLASLVVEALRKPGATLSVLQVGEDVGELFLQEATRRLAGSIHRLEAGDDLRTRVFEVVAAQYRPTLTDLEVSFDGVDVHHVYPDKLPSLVAGSEVVVTGRYDRAGSGALRLTGTVDGRPFERRYPITLSAEPQERSANSFVPRLWAREHLDALSVSSYAENRPEIVRVSQEYTVLSRATAFLVLENERMYREFNVKRRRGRDYWKGEKVATRTLKDSDPDAAGKAGDKKVDGLEQSANKGFAEGKLGAGGRGSAGPSLASSRSEAQEAPASAAPAMEREARKMPAKRKPSRAAMDDLSSPFDAAPSADKPRAMPKAKTPAPRPAPEPRPTLVKDARRSRRHHHRHAYTVPVHTTKIVPMIDITVSPRAAAQQNRMERLVQRAPLRRGAHQAYHRALVRNGRYGEAMRHAIKWAELDGSRVGPLLALADMQAALGRAEPAVRSYSGTVEVQPWNVRLHRDLARMYRNRGELRRSCAHEWSIMSLHPKRVEHHLALARCLAQIPEERPRAMQLLTELSSGPLGKQRGHAARIGQALAKIAGGEATTDRGIERGAVVLKATWDQAVDLDLALVTPKGQRLSVLRTGRQGRAVNSSDGRTAEVLALRWAGNGSYRIEVGPGDASAADASVSGTLLIKARGKTRAVPFVVSGKSKPVARLELATRYERRFR